VNADVELLRTLARAAASLPVSLPAGVPDPAATRVRLENGIPALTGEPLLGWDALTRNASLLASAVADAGTPAVERAAGALAAVHDPADRERILAAALADPSEAVPAAHPHADVLVLLADWAARPALRAAAAALGAAPQGRWTRGRCPACGAPPALSVVSGKERHRRLYCGRCLTGWGYPRTRCPGCGEHRHDRLGYLHAPGEGDHRRAEVCDTCGTYLKSVALLDPPAAERLLALDLETVALDFAALDRGYARV
jgi:formate dehydrogenase accessory protein FdhE